MKVYWIGRNRFEKNYAYAEEADNAKYSEFEVCPLCGKRVSLLKWQPPLKILLSSKKLGDIIIGTPAYLIISEKLKDLFEKTKLKGLKTFHKIDKLMYKKEIIDAEYYYVQPERLDVKFKVVEGEFMIKENWEMCKLCNPDDKIYNKIHGLKLADETINNITTDIFVSYSHGDTTFCSEKFVKLCRDNKLTNWESHIVPISEFKI
jgi:hypothetical protein